MHNLYEKFYLLVVSITNTQNLIIQQYHKQCQANTDRGHFKDNKMETAVVKYIWYLQNA